MKTKKLLIFIKINRIKILVISIFAILFIAALLFFYFGLQDFFSLEPWMRKQMYGQMGLMMPMFFFVHLFMIPFYFGMHFYLMSGGGLGKLGTEKLSKADVNVRWDEVIGMEGAKKEAWEIIKLLKDRSLLNVIGGKIVKGTLMIGPPGCGKTYLAKAIATECGMPLISASGSDFVGMLVGQGAARMKIGRAHV